MKEDEAAGAAAVEKAFRPARINTSND